MSASLTEKGRQSLLSALIDFSGATIKSKLVDLLTADDACAKAITSCTGVASPITVTKASHGCVNGDIVVVGGVGGNLSANQRARVANATTNTFDLQTCTGSAALAMTGSGAYTTGGWFVNLTQTAFLSDVDASSVGTDVALSGKTITNGVAFASAWIHTTVPAQTNPIVGLWLYKDTGVATTSPAFFWDDGQIQVVIAAAVSTSNTSVAVEPLAGPLDNGTVLYFSNGQALTLAGAASFGDRVLTVSAAGGPIAVGHTAEAYISSANLPFPPNGGSITITPSSTAHYGLFKV